MVSHFYDVVTCSNVYSMSVFFLFFFRYVLVPSHSHFLYPKMPLFDNVCVQKNVAFGQRCHISTSLIRHKLLTTANRVGYVPHRNTELLRDWHLTSIVIVVWWCHSTSACRLLMLQTIMITSWPFLVHLLVAPVGATIPIEQTLKDIKRWRPYTRKCATTSTYLRAQWVSARCFLIATLVPKEYGMHSNSMYCECL